MPTTDVNDTQFVYTGSWGYGGESTAFQGDEHFSNVPGNAYSYNFTGTRVRVFSMRHPNYGDMAISVDGGPETIVHAYAPSRVASAQIWESPVLPRGQHTVRVRVTGTKPAAAAFAYVSADRIQVVDDDVAPPPPDPDPGHDHTEALAKLAEADGLLIQANASLDQAVTDIRGAVATINNALTQVANAQGKVDAAQLRLDEIRLSLETEGPGPDPPPPPPATGKVFLLHEQAPPSVSHLVGNVATYDALPFDGTSVFGNWSDRVLTQTPLDEAAVRAELAPLKNATFSRCKRNMVLVYATPFGNWQSNMSVPAANFAKLAAVIADNPNVYGIKFDIEEYFGPTWHDCGGMADTNCRQAAHAAGKLIMQSMIQRNPNVRVMTSFGPWVSSTEAHSEMTRLGMPNNDVAWANKYQGNFIAGMIEAAGPMGGEYLDGGELYWVPTQDQRRAFTSYMDNGFKDVSYIVTPAVRPVWEHFMCWGVYDWPGTTSTEWTTRGPWTSAMLRQDNIDALATTERVVWFYSERWRFASNPRTGKPAPPAEHMQALRDAYATKSA